jgi:5'-3' exonuclease
VCTVRARKQALEEVMRLIACGAQIDSINAACARAAEIKPEVVAAVVAALRERNRPCLVALSDADGVAAYLFSIDYIDLFLTEDSDALVTGCKRV